MLYYGANTNDHLTDQVLTLPQEYRPICLRNDPVLQKKNNSNKDSTICSTSTGTSSTFVHPTLPEISNNILTRINTQLEFSPMKNTQKIHHLIDLFDQPKYAKSDLPSMKLRDSSIDQEQDNKTK